MQYVTKVRMHRAREQLGAERVSVSELAARFGYESAPAFARAFKRHTGLSPGAVRRERADPVQGSRAIPWNGVQPMDLDEDRPRSRAAADRTARATE